MAYENKEEVNNRETWTLCTAHELYNAIPFGHKIVDIRSKDEFVKCHIQTSKHVHFSTNGDNDNMLAFKTNFLDIISSKSPGKSN